MQAHQRVYDKDSLFHKLDFEQQKEALSIEHKPIRDPRPGFPGESIYLKAWQDYMEEDPGRLQSVLFDTVCRDWLRAARVCASFMVWMGNNNGMSFTQEAAIFLYQINTKFPGGQHCSPSDAYLMAWGRHNRRQRGVNSTVRTVEAMLSPDDYIKDSLTFQRKVSWESFEKITRDDLDVVECMVAWWSGPDAKAIRKVAVPAIKAANELQFQKDIRGQDVERIT